jgi:hypothetical protein
MKILIAIVLLIVITFILIQYENALAMYYHKRYLKGKLLIGFWVLLIIVIAYLLFFE